MIAGPVIGGLFADYLSWRYAFVINVLPIAVTLVLLKLLGQKDVRETGVSIDYLGAVLCSLGLGGVVFALIEQSTLGWGSPAIYLSLAGGILAFAGFLVRQRVHRNPMLPLSLFRVRNFWTGNIATALIYGALSLNGFALGVYLQQGAHLKASGRAGIHSGDLDDDPVQLTGRCPVRQIRPPAVHDDRADHRGVGCPVDAAHQRSVQLLVAGAARHPGVRTRRDADGVAPHLSDPGGDRLVTIGHRLRGQQRGVAGRRG